MNKQYIYPQNMRASATLWLWSLKDFAVIVVGALFSAMVLATTRILIPAVLTAAFAFLSIRGDETTILDFIKYAVRYFISTQQYFEWGLKSKPINKQKKEVSADVQAQKKRKRIRIQFRDLSVLKHLLSEDLKLSMASLYSFR